MTTLRGSIASIDTKVYVSGDIVARVVLEIPLTGIVEKQSLKDLHDELRKPIEIQIKEAQ